MNSSGASLNNIESEKTFANPTPKSSSAIELEPLQSNQLKQDGSKGLVKTNEQQNDSRQEEAAKTNELMTREACQRRDRERSDQQVVASSSSSKLSEDSNKTSETNDESEAANGKSVSFDELPREQTESNSGGGDGATDFELNDEPAQSSDEPDYSEPSDWFAGHSSGGSINRRAFFVSNSLTESGKNGTTSRLASLISHKPIGSGLRNFAKNSTVLRAIEKRRLRQRERLKRIKLSAGGGGSKQLQLNKSIGLGNNNKKRDLEQAQTRQSLTTSSTTLGPGQSLLALNGVSDGATKNGHSNLSLKTNAFKHLPSLASSSTQISSAIQRLISNKFGLTSAASSATAANANSDLTAALNNHTLNGLVHGQNKQSSLFGDTTSQLQLQLNPDLDDDDNDQADFSSTSASDQHQHSLMPTRAQFGGSRHHFDVSGADNGQEQDEADQLNGDRLVELLQSGHWTQSGSEDHRATRSSLLSLQAAQRQNKLLRKPVGGKQLIASDKQTIPIEIIGLDPSVTNSILFGTNNAQATEQQQPPIQQQRFNQNQFIQTNGNGQSLDEGPNSTGGQQFNQMGSASELDFHENSPNLVQFANVLANSTEFKSDGINQQAQKVESINALNQDSSASAQTIRPNPSSVLHIHHFHHTTEPDKTRQERQQEVGESSEQADQTNRQVGEIGDESRPPGGQTSDSSADTLNKVSEAPNGQQNQGESVELQTAVEQIEQQQQQPAPDDKTDAKRVRFVTRNSLRDKTNFTVTGPGGRQNVDFLLQPADQNQMPSNQFMPIRPQQQQQSSSYANNNLQPLNAGLEGSGSGDNGMLMVAYRPAGRVRASTSDHQQDSGSLQQQSLEQPFRVQKQPDFWLTSLMGDGNRSQLIISQGDETSQSPAQRPQLMPIRQSPNFNEASESNHMLLGSNKIVDQQRQRLVNAAMVAASSGSNSPPRSHHHVPSSITNQPKPHHSQQQQQQELINVMLKQQPKLNPALMMQLRDKQNAATLAIESVKAIEPNWISEDERLLSQYTELTEKRNNNNSRPQHIITANNLPNTLNSTSFNQQQQRLRPELQNPFQNHYQNFVENLVMMKRLRQKNEESQLQALMNQPQLNSRLTNNELAVVMQEQLSKQMHNRTQPTSLHRHNLDQQNTTSGRYELTMASDRAPAKMLQQQMASGNSTLLRTVNRPNNQTTFSVNENFHVPNTSSFNNKLPAPAVILGSGISISPISSSPPTGHGGGVSSVESTHQTRVNFNATARPTLASETRESFMDSAEGVSNLALAFIFVVSLLTFIMIAVSMVYRRRRSSTTRRDSSRTGDAPRSSTSARLSIAQRTRHLMRSNMFAGVTRSRSRTQPGEIRPTASSNPTTSSANSSTSSLTSIANLNRIEQETSIKTLNLDHRNHLPHDPHQTSSVTRSAWAKHLKPVLRRAPTLQPDTSRGCKKMANCLQQQLGGSNLMDSNNYASKYVRGNQSGAANIGNTFDVSRRGREIGAPPGSHRGNKSDKYQTASVETATNLTNDGTLALNPDSDVRTLNTRLQKAYLQHEPRPGRQDSPATTKQPPDSAADSAHYKKQLSRRAH